MTKSIHESIKESDNRILGMAITWRWSCNKAKILEKSVEQVYSIEKNLEFEDFLIRRSQVKWAKRGMGVPHLMEAIYCIEPVVVYGRET